jgi:hypothetical protein
MDVGGSSQDGMGLLSNQMDLAGLGNMLKLGSEDMYLRWRMERGDICFMILRLASIAYPL